MDRYLRSSGVIAAQVTAVVLAVVLVTSAATGWLYWARAGVARWPGPRVADVLPLDELPGYDSVPLVVCAAAFAIAGVMLGLVARAARLDRLTAAWALAAGTGIWLLAVDAFSLLVVRQVPAADALRAAARLQPVYIAAALAGAGGALLGRNERRGAMMPRLLAWLVAAGGIIDLVSALFPHPGSALGSLARLAPGVAGPAAHVLAVPADVVLVLTSRGLIRRNRRAWRLAVTLLGLSVLLQLLRGPGYAGATLAGLTAMALLARRDDFPYRGDPAAEPSALLRLSVMLLAAVLYGVTAVWVYRTASGLPFSPPFAGLLGPQAELQSAQRLQRRVLLRLKGVMALQLDNLLRFNGQFSPAWIPRYVILQAWADLPRVAVAAMAAEGYLPYAALVRGRGWASASGDEPEAEATAHPAEAVAHVDRR